MDYRIKENRLTGFMRWYAWEVQYKDCDPALWMMNYLNKRYEHNTEQRIWFCWLYGNTYYLPTAWVLMQEFPDFELATIDRLLWWNAKNYKRLRYQTDTKYNKGHIPAMFASYQKVMGKSLQYDVLCKHYGDTPQQNFDNLWKFVNNSYHKFGRYTTWFYLQSLRHTAGIIMEPTSLFLSDYNGSKSHRNGLLYALGWDDWIDAKLTAREYADTELAAIDILQEMHIKYPNLKFALDLFSMETALCAYKKLFRNHNSRYLGYYIDRQAEEIYKVENDDWFGIEWQVLWQARQEELDNRLLHNRIQTERYADFYNSGTILNLEWVE